MTIQPVKIDNVRGTKRVAKFERHIQILVWKCYMQRQRRWRSLLLKAFIAASLFLVAVFISKPVFLTPLQAEPEPPLTSSDIFQSLARGTILGYAPNVEPNVQIMIRAADLLNTGILAAPTVDDLNIMLYKQSDGKSIINKVIWIEFHTQVNNTYKFSIRCTDSTRKPQDAKNKHLRTGFLAVQVAVSQAILEHVSPKKPRYDLSLVSMPVSPLMEEEKVRRAIASILMCFTVALLPPVLATEAFVVNETKNRLKRALRIRDVECSTIYISWFVYALMTALPICMLGSFTLILIFRWIHLMYALVTLMAYECVMIMLALIMAMFHDSATIACVWTTLFTLLQTFLAELIVHHQYDMQHGAITFIIQMFLPPLGLVHGLHQFALLQTTSSSTDSLIYTLALWMLMILFYFQLLMLLQRTISQDRAIGGQVSWRAMLFKKVEDVNKVRCISTPTGRERDNLQEVDEFVAKAISFRNVSKSIMGVAVFKNVTFDIYRGEFTTLFSERIEERMMNTIEDLLTGLTCADSGTINLLGCDLTDGHSYMTELMMLGYCDRSYCLIEDLTVDENISFFIRMCLWHETNQCITEYGHMRAMRLKYECDLDLVWHERVENLAMYYRAQLCWAIAILLEPRVVLMPNFSDSKDAMSVFKDKIMQYKKEITIVKISYSSIELEYADRVFLFDNKILIFGGTPAYMFFKFGREYRLRLSLRSDVGIDDEHLNVLIEKAKEAGATVRAHLGSLLIFRLPTSPTDKVAALIKDITINSKNYGISNMNISLPDSEEVHNRAKNESRASTMRTRETPSDITARALKRIAEGKNWRYKRSRCNIIHLKAIGWKYLSFYIHYRFFLIITIISAIVAGVFMGLTLSTLLYNLSSYDEYKKKFFQGELLTVEELAKKTNLVLSLDGASESISLANAYVLSQTNATESQIQDMAYTALSSSASLTEYLITQAIDSPQHYVHMFAYGMDVVADAGHLTIQALYCPIHRDNSAAARSLARVYMALMRHYTGALDATVEVIDNPLILDQTPWLDVTVPLVIQFLMILTIFHKTLVPSKEHGLIRHSQSHALNFSPTRYWFTLYFCDLILYWMLVGLMTVVMVVIILLVVPITLIQYRDMLVVPFMLVIYGVGCIPQAYIFSLGPRAGLNSMAFVITNIVFGETTIVTTLLYGDMSHFALHFLAFVSPQYNMALALVKIKLIFFHNSECEIFKFRQLCSSKSLHKCCPKCGVLQACFKRKEFLSKSLGILYEVIATLIIAVIFMTILLLWEYRMVQRLYQKIIHQVYTRNTPPTRIVTEGARREKADVYDKLNQLKQNRSEKVDTFGEYLLACKVTKKSDGFYVLQDVYLGLGKGEALALSGLKRHGRMTLCEMLAGLNLPTEGTIISMSKWKLNISPHFYSRQISICCDSPPLPEWMSVFDGLKLIARLRGVPDKHVNKELIDYIEALGLIDQGDISIFRLSHSQKKRLNFAAAVIGAPPVIILDECTAYQKYSVRRAMYHILYYLRKRGHAIFIGASNVESHMPVTNRLAILVDGRIQDIDLVDNLVERYSSKGYTVVVHLKDEVDVKRMFSAYFKSFVINDTSEVLVNVQVLDENLDWADMFETMEQLKARNNQVYSYIVCAIPIDYIYNSMVNNETGPTPTGDFLSRPCFRALFHKKKKIKPDVTVFKDLVPFEKKYDITSLKELPWSVIFQR